MWPLSHVVAGLLAVDLMQYATGSSALFCQEILIVVSALLPDVLDKALYWSRLCHATRSFGHCILFILAWSLLGGTLFGQQVGWILFASSSSHLLVDLFFGYVPLLYPIQSFRYPSMIHTKTSKQQLKTIEAVALMYLVLVLGPRLLNFIKTRF